MTISSLWAMETLYAGFCAGELEMNLDYIDHQWGDYLILCPN